MVRVHRNVATIEMASMDTFAGRAHFDDPKSSPSFPDRLSVIETSGEASTGNPCCDTGEECPVFAVSDTSA